jgi:hypothetical protein
MDQPPPPRRSLTELQRLASIEGAIAKMQEAIRELSRAVWTLTEQRDPDLNLTHEERRAQFLRSIPAYIENMRLTEEDLETAVRAKFIRDPEAMRVAAKALGVPAERLAGEALRTIDVGKLREDLRSGLRRQAVEADSAS